jgi:5-methyltetrahydrofolate--homocysteine methyltransferase
MNQFLAEKTLRNLLAQRILILDGAMGTMIQQYKLTEQDYRGGENGRFKDFKGPIGKEFCNKGNACGCGANHNPAPQQASRELFVKGNNELLSLTQPNIIQEIHEQYLAAGADIIETNTFGATSVAQDDYHMGHLVYEMNLASAKLACAACDKYNSLDKPRFVRWRLRANPKNSFHFA